MWIFCAKRRYEKERFEKQKRRHPTEASRTQRGGEEMAKEKPSKVPLTLRLPRELYEELKEEAERLGLDLQGIITVSLWGHFESHSVVPK